VSKPAKSRGDLHVHPRHAGVRIGCERADYDDTPTIQVVAPVESTTLKGPGWLFHYAKMALVFA
jgi:hypothetical protein